MKANKAFLISCILALAFSCGSCSGKKAKAGERAEAPPNGIREGSAYKVYVVMDTVDDWSSGIRDGLVQGLDKALAGKGATAAWEIFDTKLDTAEAARIEARIRQDKPDLVCAINYPSAFADINITQKLKGAQYRFVSENAISVESGTIDSWAKPGGNVTGVGVFVQLNSILRLTRKVRPEVKTILSYSWDQMPQVNAWWKAELARACKEEGFSMDFRLIKSVQDECAIYSSISPDRKDIAILCCISAYVNEDGSPANMKETLMKVIRGPKPPFNLAYEDAFVGEGGLMGACVIWKDLGAQMADKAVRVLSGENPGDIPWEYPRKYAIVLNMETAKRIGISFPQEILDAAFRIYTDLSGNFMGKGD